MNNAPKSDLCPKCGSDAIRYKKDRGLYICVSNRLDEDTDKRVFCKSTFEKPVKGVSKFTVYQMSKEARANAFKKFNTLFDITRKVAIRSIEYHEGYMSMLDEDIKTLCKKHAFLEDKVIIQINHT